MRELLGHAYQLAGSIEDCPVEVLDAYSAAAQGEDFVIPGPFATRIKDSQIDGIHEVIDSLMKRGSFHVIDGLLLEKNVNTLTADIMLSYLTVTLPVKSKLVCRPMFFNQCKLVLSDRGYPDTILQGLE